MGAGSAFGTLRPSQHSVAFCIQYRPEFSKDFSKNRKNAYNYMGYVQIASKSLKLRVDTYKRLTRLNLQSLLTGNDCVLTRACERR